MRKGWMVVLLAALVAGCVSKSDLEQEQQHSAELQAALDRAQQQATTLQTQVEQLQKQVASLQAASASATAAAAATPAIPALPVTLLLQPVKGEPGYSVTLTTTVKQDFPIDLTLESKSAKTTKHKLFSLSQEGQTSFRFIEGVGFENGDVITVASQGYQPLVKTVGQ
jgi:uncharacterized protein YlxW (UPF0749 family)